MLTDCELPQHPRFLAVAPISHVGGTKVIPALMRGGTVHLMMGFDPDKLLATVVRKPGMAVDAQSLVNLVKERKGSQQAPKRVEFVDALPLTSLGKLDKRALREPHWAGRSRNVA